MRSCKPLGLPVILIVAWAGISSGPVFAQGPASRTSQDPLLDTLNGDFRAEYQQALTATLAQAGPVIPEEGDNLILVHGGRTSVNIKPVGYHELKAVAHIPLALFVMLSFPPEQNLSVGRRQRLEDYSELMMSAYATLPRRHFTAEQLPRQKEIFQASFELVDEVLAKGQLNPQRLESFTRRTAPLLLANVEDATALEMRALYATTADWKKLLTPAEWKSLHVVMIGPHMPRDGECSIQFF